MNNHRVNLGYLSPMTLRQGHEAEEVACRRSSSTATRNSLFAEHHATLRVCVGRLVQRKWREGAQVPPREE